MSHNESDKNVSDIDNATDKSDDEKSDVTSVKIEKPSKKTKKGKPSKISKKKDEKPFGNIVSWISFAILILSTTAIIFILFMVIRTMCLRKGFRNSINGDGRAMSGKFSMLSMEMTPGNTCYNQACIQLNKIINEDCFGEMKPISNCNDVTKSWLRNLVGKWKNSPRSSICSSKLLKAGKKWQKTC
ncbi:hypothetical protein SNEBB_003309 [Seison nebaliae]|nr:hypothetical protein SNEBB_003309 [Seison nebaliae]